MRHSRRRHSRSPLGQQTTHQQASNRAGSGKRLQAWERQAVLDAYRKGEKLEAIAAEFGCSCAAFRSWRSELELPREGGH